MVQIHINNTHIYKKKVRTSGPHRNRTTHKKSKHKNSSGMAPTIESAGAEAPLLPGRHGDGPRRGPALSGAVFNVATSIIGAGIMSIPATLKVLGVIPAFLMIVLIGVVVEISVEFMLRFTYSGEARTYAALMRESFGGGGAIAVQICVMITNLGCLIMYLIIIGEQVFLIFVFSCCLLRNLVVGSC